MNFFKTPPFFPITLTRLKKTPVKPHNSIIFNAMLILRKLCYHQFCTRDLWLIKASTVSCLLICDALLYLVSFVQLVKVTLLQRFLNCTNNTKLRKASHIMLTLTETKYILRFCTVKGTFLPAIAAPLFKMNNFTELQVMSATEFTMFTKLNLFNSFSTKVSLRFFRGCFFFSARKYIRFNLFF